MYPGREHSRNNLRIRGFRQVWRIIDLVPRQQHDAEVLAQVSPRGVMGRSLWHEHSHHVLIAETLKTLAVAQDLAEAEPKLLFEAPRVRWRLRCFGFRNYCSMSLAY